jgi:hypothetical protein
LSAVFFVAKAIADEEDGYFYAGGLFWSSSEGRGAEGNQALGGAEGDAALCAFSHKRLYTFSQTFLNFGQSNIIETNVALKTGENFPDASRIGHNFCSFT